MLDLLVGHPDVIFVTGSQVADWFEAEEPATAEEDHGT
jgi:hypothetical protein